MRKRHRNIFSDCRYWHNFIHLDTAFGMVGNIEFHIDQCCSGYHGRIDLCYGIKQLRNQRSSNSHSIGYNNTRTARVHQRTCSDLRRLNQYLQHCSSKRSYQLHMDASSGMDRIVHGSLYHSCGREHQRAGIGYSEQQLRNQHCSIAKCNGKHSAGSIGIDLGQCHHYLCWRPGYLYRNTCQWRLSPVLPVDGKRHERWHKQQHVQPEARLEQARRPISGDG